MPECSVVQKSWSELTLEELYCFVKLRTDVFFVEQRIDEEELDNRDQEPTTEHLWIADATGTAAYLRVLFDAEASHLDANLCLGRVGLAQVLLARVIEQHGHESMLLHSQEYIAPLYAKFGFGSFGERYIEAGIPHISMYRAGH